MRDWSYRTATGVYNDGAIKVHLTCTMEPCDYGVPGSPVWHEPIPGTVEVTALEIFGVPVPLDDIRPDLMAALRDLEPEWEGSE